MIHHEAHRVFARRQGRLLALVAAASVVAACAAPPSSSAPVAIFVLRHAEKATNDPKDPDLSDAGRARAEALAAMFEHAGVTHLFATDRKRTQQTLEPLAARCGRRIEVVPAEEVAQQVAELLALPAGAVAVVSGHNNTIPAIARSLGGAVDDLIPSPNGDTLPEYGRVLLLLLPPPGSPSRKATITLRLQVGGASTQ